MNPYLIRVRTVARTATMTNINKKNNVRPMPIIIGIKHANQLIVISPKYFSIKSTRVIWDNALLRIMWFAF